MEAATEGHADMVKFLLDKGMAFQIGRYIIGRTLGCL